MSFSPLSFSDIEGALLPGSFLRDYVRWAGVQTDAPLPYHLGGALSALAACAPPTLSVPTFGGVIHAPVWVLLVGPSGVSRKSTVVNMAARLIRAVNPRLIGHLPDSPEGLIESMAAQPNQILVYSEFGELLAKSKMGRLEPIRTLLTNFYDCQTYTRRLRNSTTVIPDPRLSILGGCTETYLAAYTGVTDWTGGLMSRFIVIVGRAEHLASRYQGDPQAEADLIVRLKQMHGRKIIPAQGFTPEADTLFKLWVSAQDERARASRTPDWLRGALSRAGNVAMKVALLSAFAAGRASDQAWFLALEDLQVGIAVAEAHVKSVTWVVEVLCGTTYQRQRMTVIDMLREGPQPKAAIARHLKVSKRDLENLLNGIIEERTVIGITAPTNKLVYYSLRNLEEVVEEEEGAENDPLSAVLGTPAPAPTLGKAVGAPGEPEPCIFE